MGYAPARNRNRPLENKGDKPIPNFLKNPVVHFMCFTYSNFHFMSPANTRRKIVCLLKRAPSICGMLSFRFPALFGSMTRSFRIITRKSNLRENITTLFWVIFRRRSFVSFIPFSKTILHTKLSDTHNLS